MRFLHPTAMLIATIALHITLPSRIEAQSNAAVQDVEIPTTDGIRLTGWYRDAGAGSPGVLMFPMCGGTGERGWIPVAENLLKAGVSSLMLAEAGWTEREARGDAAIRFLRSRLGSEAKIAVTGGSCGVALAIGTAGRNPDQVRALVVLSGPHTDANLEFIRKSPSIAIFSGASEGEPPSPEWARALKQASSNADSHVEIWSLDEHGTDYFVVKPEFARQIAEWLVSRLKQ